MLNAEAIESLMLELDEVKYFFFNLILHVSISGSDSLSLIISLSKVLIPFSWFNTDELVISLVGWLTETVVFLRIPSVTFILIAWLSTFSIVSVDLDQFSFFSSVSTDFESLELDEFPNVSHEEAIGASLLVVEFSLFMLKFIFSIFLSMLNRFEFLIVSLLSGFRSFLYEKFETFMRIIVFVKENHFFF